MAKVQDSAIGISLNQKEQLKMMKKLKSSFLLDKYISFCYSVTQVFVIFNYLNSITYIQLLWGDYHTWLVGSLVIQGW